MLSSSLIGFNLLTLKDLKVLRTFFNIKRSRRVFTLLLQFDREVSSAIRSPCSPMRFESTWPFHLVSLNHYLHNIKRSRRVFTLLLQFDREVSSAIRSPCSPMRFESTCNSIPSGILNHYLHFLMFDLTFILP